MAATSTAPATTRATGRRRGGRGEDGRVGVWCRVVDMAPPPGVWLTPLPTELGPAGSRGDTATGTRPPRLGHQTATAAAADARLGLVRRHFTVSWQRGQLDPRCSGYCSPVATTEPVGFMAVWRPGGIGQPPPARP